MFPTTFNSEAVFLLPYLPDSRGMAATFDVLTRSTRAQAGREGRSALRYTLRTNYRATLQLFGGQVAEFNRALKYLENKRVLCPFWPAAQRASSVLAHWASTGIWLTIEPDLSTWEIHTTAEPATMTPTAAALRVPLMLGIFDNDPKPLLAKPTQAACAIRFVETGPADYALRPKNVTFADGPALTGRTPKVFPLPTNWTEPPAYGEASVEIERRDTGYTRTPAEAYHPQAPEQLLEAEISTFSADESAQLLAFFHARQGNVDGFWIEGMGELTALASDTSAGSAVVHVRMAAEIGDTRYIAFVRPGQPSICREVISINTEANTLTLNASPGTLAKGSVRMVSLILARFISPKITFNFTAGPKADVAMTLREVSAEYTTPAGETYGVTIGALARKAQLYRFKLKYPGGDVVTRYTSYEREVVASGEVFTPLSGLDHKSIIDSLDVEKTAVKFVCRIFPGSVLAKLSPFRLEVPLWVEVLDCEPDATGVAGTPAMRFIGEVTKSKRRGPFLDFEAVHLLADLQENVPTALIQGADNNELYGPASGIDEADWTFTATIVSVSASGASLTINSLARPAGVPTIDAGYFGYGRAWRGSGSALQSRTIVNSTALSGGALVINLSNPFDGIPSGSISLSPGYSGDPAEALSKFNAFNRVLAFPFVPAGTPSLVAIVNETQTGKK